MKKIVNVSGLIVLLMIMITSCKKEVRALDENLATVSVLNAPADGASIQLQPTSNASVVFSWQKTVAEDGGLVLYELVFDKENGDFNNPIFKTVSDGGGVDAQITLTHKQLTKIASLGGIASSSTGKLKWTVIASKATNRKTASQSRTLVLERPAGFAELPSELYITGSATEGGDDVTKAVSFKMLEPGIFEIYTSLKAGTYYLTDKPAADAKKFYIDGTVIKEGATPVTVSGDTKVYRIKLDFNVATQLEATEIKSMGLYMSAYNSEITQLNYVGNGVFQSPVTAVEFYQFSWGRDERYKFAIHTPTTVEYFGSVNANNVSPVGQPASYFYLTPVTNSQWDNTFKFNPSADNHNVKVTVNFGPAGSYTHEVVTL